MCDQAQCRDTCLRIASVGTLGGAVLGGLVVWDLARSVAPAVETGVRWFLVAAGVAVLAAAGGTVALGVLRWRRGRPVASARVVRGVAWRAGVPAAAVPLALAASVPVFPSVALTVGALAVFQAVRFVAAAPQVAYVYPALLAAQARELPAAAPLAVPAGPVVAGEVIKEA